MIRILLVTLAIVLMAVWIFRPAYLRWRDHLRDAPELKDAGFKQTFLVAFKGLRTKMVARLLDGLGLLMPVYNVISEYAGAGGIDLNALLPAIPIGKDIALTGGQYAPVALLGIGRVMDYLRTISNTRAGTIDPNLAVAVATESQVHEGTTPSPALAAICDTSADASETMRVAGTDRRKPRAARKAGKVKPKRKAA